MSNSKPPFDPTKPFEVVEGRRNKPPFDPNKPFEVVGGPEDNGSFLSSGSIDADVAALAKKHNISPQALFDRANDRGMQTDAESKDKSILGGVKKTYDSTLSNVDSLLGGVPTWIHKKLQDANTEKAFDALDDVISKKKAGAQQVVEGAAEFAGGALLIPNVVAPAAKGASLVNNVARGTFNNTIPTAVSSLTHSKSGDELEDLVTGLQVNAALNLAIPVLGKAVSSTAKAANNVFLDVPKEVTERYMKNSEAIKASKGLRGVAEDAVDAVAKLKGITSSQSSEAYGLLEDTKIPKKAVADILKHKYVELMGQGAFTNQSKKEGRALLHVLTNVEAMEGEILPGGLVKNLIRQMDELPSQLKNAGDKSSSFDRSLKGARSEIDSLLKTANPEYARHMADNLAPSTRAAKAANKIYGNNESALKSLKSFATKADDKANVWREGTLEDLSAKAGVPSLVEAAKNASTKEFFATNGSRKVLGGGLIGGAGAGLLGGLVFGGVGGIVGGSVGGIVGGATGMLLDKQGRKVSQKILDTIIKLDALLLKPEMQRFVQPLKAAASRGSSELILAHKLLSGKYPELAVD